MRRKPKYETSIQQRQLFYKKDEDNFSLDLPQKYQSKISHLEHKRIKEAFYLNSSSTDFRLNRQKFLETIRSLGIVLKTNTLLKYFQESEEETMEWQTFLQAYIGLRNHKGSYKEVDTAIGLLNRQYNGRWEQLDKDLCEIGDILTKQELAAFKDLMGDKIMNPNNLKNVLLGYK